MVWFVLLRPDLKATEGDTRNWFVRAFSAIKVAWSSHGSVWKRWLCFIAGYVSAIFTLWLLGA